LLFHHKISYGDAVEEASLMHSFEVAGEAGRWRWLGLLASSSGMFCSRRSGLGPAPHPRGTTQPSTSFSPQDPVHALAKLVRNQNQYFNARSDFSTFNLGEMPLTNVKING
jgi:hypothetical protein